MAFPPLCRFEGSPLDCATVSYSERGDNPLLPPANRELPILFGQHFGYALSLEPEMHDLVRILP
jgi:hypothetical protein